MADILELNLEDEEQLCTLGAALSSPARIQILRLLYHNSFNVAEIAQKLQIPPSSAALYIRSLENAGLINTRLQPGSRGAMKICSRKNDQIIIKMTSDDPEVSKVSSVSMPIGCFTDCKVTPVLTTGRNPFISPSGSEPRSCGLPQDMWNTNSPTNCRIPPCQSASFSRQSCVPRH